MLNLTYVIIIAVSFAAAYYLVKKAMRDPAIGKTAKVAEGGIKRHGLGKIILGEKIINARLDTGAAEEELKKGEEVIIIEKVGDNAIVKPIR